MVNFDFSLVFVQGFSYSSFFSCISERALRVMLCGVFKLFDRQMRSRAHDNPAFNINIAHKMASNFKKGSNGEGRNLANRDKCNKRHSFAGPVCHYTKQHLSSLGRTSDFAKNLDVHLDSSNSENDREQNVLFWPPF